MIPASDMLAAGLCVLPARTDSKRPNVPAWQQYQKRLPYVEEVTRWFAGKAGPCLVCGAVSGNLEMIDFDAGGELFEAWRAKIDGALLDRLVIERTPSGGYHVVYRCEEAVCGNLKLAQRSISAPSSEPVTIGNKSFRPAKKFDGSFHVLQVLIETRGEGGLFLCDYCPGYSLLQGAWTSVPTLTASERDALLQAAWDLNEYAPPPVDLERSRSVSSCADRPGDDYNLRGDLHALLEHHGWTYVMDRGENQMWRRPGKADSWSASLRDRVFYVFSSNAAPFEPHRGYSPLSVYTLLEHGGDFNAAIKALRKDGYGEERIGVHDGVDLSRMLDKLLGKRKVVVPTPDPGNIPVDLLRIPGLVSEVMDYSLETAPYPNQVAAFCGALALQAFLAGRKVRDPGDNRSNLYLLCLAHSGSGKDWPRKVNMRIAHEAGMSEAVGDRFASGEGIQDALFLSPSMLFQTDEIDGLLQSINTAKDARHEAIMGTLLTMYSASNSVFPVRRRAGLESPGAIDQPCLTVFGTAIPNHYYEALSERMLTNGFFSRMMIFESAPRTRGQEPKIKDIPARVLTAARWWHDYSPGTGNLEKWHPVPAVVQHDDDARRILAETREEADNQYALAESRNDAVGTTVWSRTNEHVRKLALLYAVSENHLAPMIGAAAATWAAQVIMHQTRRMLYMAAGHAAETPFQQAAQRLLDKIRQSGGQIDHSALLRASRLDVGAFKALVATLCERGDIQRTEEKTSAKAKKPVTVYRLAAAEAVEDE